MSRRRKKPAKKRSAPRAPQIYEVRFADAFPPDDRIGHFVIGLAAAHNDLLLTNRFLFPPTHPNRSELSPAENVALLRLVLAQLWETHLLVQAASQTAEVTAFIERLGREYQGEKLDGPDLVAALKGEAGAGVPRLRNLLRVARNVTSHYLKPGDPMLRGALGSLSDEKARITVGPQVHDLRAEFADDVMWHAAVQLDEVDDLAELFDAASESVVSVVHLAQTALDIWLAEHGAVES